MQRSPELLTSEVWARAEGHCTQEMERQTLTPRWFAPPVPAGTALFDRGRRTLIARAGLDPSKAVVALHNLAPFDAYILGTMVLQTKKSFQELASLYGPLGEYDVGLMLGLVRTALNDPTKAIPLYTMLSAIDPKWYFEFGDYLWTLGREGEAVAATEKGIRQARDQVAMSQHVQGLVGYYCDHGRIQRAREVAQLAADVYSAGGLGTMGYFMERVGKYDEAESWYKKGAERYDDRSLLDAFYIRYQHRVGDGRFRTEAAAALKRVFPLGLERVTMGGLKPPPPRRSDEARVTGQDQRRDRIGLLLGDVVIGVDGFRVRTSEQYDCLWTLDDSPEVTVIVWREDRFLEIKGPLRTVRYGPVGKTTARSDPLPTASPCRGC
jgi:hypothetical protein